ncbi:MAG: hypothetical protein LKM45_04245 [Wolbachia endosymbiont of Alcedoecus sp.]|nr:hypothetical protein [Wolbachia endosymbiont of Alcedoecus sp.]
MSSLYDNFKQYAQFGTVPTVKQDDGSQVLQNCFYKSVDHINSVVGPVKNVLFGVKLNFSGMYKVEPTVGIAVFALTNIVLQPLYLAFAYLSYWPAKGLAKLTDKFGLKDNTESLVGYSNTLSDKACYHSAKIANFVNTVLSFAVSAVIWTAALVVTPLTWTVDKVSSKFNEVKGPKEHSTLFEIPEDNGPVR